MLQAPLLLGLSCFSSCDEQVAGFQECQWYCVSEGHRPNEQAVGCNPDLSRRPTLVFCLEFKQKHCERTHTTPKPMSHSTNQSSMPVLASAPALGLCQRDTLPLARSAGVPRAHFARRSLAPTVTCASDSGDDWRSFDVGTDTVSTPPHAPPIHTLAMR